MRLPLILLVAIVSMGTACSSASFEVAQINDATGDGAADSMSNADTGGTAQDSTVNNDGPITNDAPTDGPSGDAMCSMPGTGGMFDRGCTNDASCSIGYHLVDCCGTQIAVSFNHAYREAFDTAETAWRKACPAACGCPAGPIMTESGMSTGDMGKVQVKCVMTMGMPVGKCTTSVSG